MSYEINKTPVKKATYAYGSTLNYWEGTWATNPAAIAFAAQHFNLIILESGAKWAYDPSLVQSLKTQNPNMKILGYDLFTGTYPEGDGWAEINLHEDWFIHDVNGNRVFHSAAGWYLMDSGNMGWRQYFVSYINAKLASMPSYDGVFCDNVWSGYGDWMPFYSVLKPEDITRYVADIIGMLRYIKTNLLAGKLVLINSDQWAENSFLAEVDGKTSEGFAHATWEAPNEFNFNMDMIEYFSRDSATGKYVIALSGSMPGTPEEIEKVVKFCYAAYICAFNGANMHFCFNDWNSPDGSHGYYPIMDTDIGSALTTYYTSQNVIMRDFTKGKVLLNASPDMHTIDISEAGSTLLDGTPVTSVTLEPWTAEILLHTLIPITPVAPKADVLPLLLVLGVIAFGKKR